MPDSFEVTPQPHIDERGAFLEWYRFDALADAIGHSLDLRQGNLSVSKRGVVRGVHFADVPTGQAKYVTAVHGAVLDFVVDIRVGSPTYGSWDSVVLDDRDRRAVYISEGLGHAFVALTEGACVSYLVSDVYRPGAEHGVTPLDPEVGLRFPLDGGEPVLSAKDMSAPTLAEAAAAGTLPTWDAMRDYYASLSEGGR